MKIFMASLEKLDLKRKLIIGFTLSILIAIIIGVLGVINLQRVTEDMTRLYDFDTIGIYHIGEANVNLVYMGRALRSMLIAPDQETRDNYQALIQMRRENLKASLVEVRQTLIREEAIALFDTLQNDLIEFYQYNQRAENLIVGSETGELQAAKLITSPAFVAAVKKADDSIEALSQFKLKAAAISKGQALAAATQAETLMVGLMGAGILLVILVGALISSAIKKPYDRIREAVQGLSEGQVDQPIPYLDYKNEIGLMAHAIEFLREIYRKSNDDFWVKTQVSMVVEAIQGADDFSSLTQTAISKLTPMVGAGHGAFYVADAEGTYHLLASYGFRERKHLSNSYNLGDGLVGQCALEKSTIKLTAPKDYIRISSGLGEGPPATIIVSPIIHGDRVLGVIEFGSFQEFKDREMVLLEQIVLALASTMAILDRNVKTRELLQATKEQAERMEMQAAQLEEQTVEMEAQQAELLETENWFKSIIETAPDGMLVVDTSGRILISNPALSRLFGHTTLELAKGNLSDLFSKDSSIHQAIKEETRQQHHGSWLTLQGQHKDGEYVAVCAILSALPMRGARGICTSIAIRAVESE